MYAPQIVKNVNGEDFTMAALVMQVNGFQFQLKVYIALDEGSNSTKWYHHRLSWRAGAAKRQMGYQEDNLRNTMKKRTLILAAMLSMGMVSNK